MAKKESTYINMTITLVLITIAAGLSLGYINEITKGPIAEARLARTTNALITVLPEFNNEPINQVEKIKLETAKDSIEIYQALLDENDVGTAIVASSEKGYNGLIKIMVGFYPNGVIRNIAVLEQKETPGLGTKIKNDKFISQYRDQDPATFDLRVKKDQGEIDALTGATITTRAFSEAVQEAYNVFMKNQSPTENQADE